MAKPIVIPPVQTVSDQFRAIMRDPRVRKAVKKNPKLAAEIRMRLEARAQQPGRPVGAAGADQSRLYRQPSPATWFHGAPVMVEGQTSLAAVVRAQRDSFLVDDGMQVAGDYTDAIRKQAGGMISPPEMPPVGYAAANYSYPSDAMRTGAALGKGVRPQAAMFTSSRKPLPTASFYPGAFVASRPDSINRNLIVNKPVPMPRETVRGVRREMRRGVITSSPSDDRRRVLSTLMGLGANATAKDPRRGTTTYMLLADFLENDTEFRSKRKTVANALAKTFGLISYLPSSESKMTPDEKKRWGFDGDVGVTSTDGAIRLGKRTGYYILIGLKSVLEQVILTLIMAEKFDLNTPAIKLILDATPLKSRVSDGDYNRAVNDVLNKFYGDQYGPLIMALGGQMPFDLKATGVREYLIKYLYRKVWGVEIPTVVYNGLSSKLACELALGSRMDTAIDQMMLPEFAPDKTPRVYTCPAAGEMLLPDPGGDTSAGGGGGGGGDETASTPANMTLVKVGVFGGLALLAVGIYAKVR